MTGYQEILTDPSYAGQMITLHPPCGQKGLNDNDFESARPVSLGAFRDLSQSL